MKKFIMFPIITFPDKSYFELSDICLAHPAFFLTVVSWAFNSSSEVRGVRMHSSVTFLILVTRLYLIVI